MKYPYIGINEQGTKAFFFSNNNQVILSAGAQSVLEVGRTYKSIIPAFYKNITHEYLQNTYGEVVSPGHAEFIIGLCLENLINFAVNNARRKYFAINGGKLYFFCLEIDASNIGSKKITIPLPPKETLKNAGDNLIFGCEDSKRDEWPQVGSSVTWRNGAYGGEVKALDGDLAWIKSNMGDYYVTEYIEKLTKPKTPKEELRDDIFKLVCCIEFRDENKEDKSAIVDLLSKYNITKKPQ